MSCAACQTDNPPGSKFCIECGASLFVRCAKCSAALLDKAKFCSQCGEPTELLGGGRSHEDRERSVHNYTPPHLAKRILSVRSALEGERKQVTVMFCDIKNSLKIAGQLDAEDWHEILDRFFALLTVAVHRFGGTVNQYTGDGIMALFGAPIAHEDHARRGCHAALEIRDKLRRFAIDLRTSDNIDFGVRIGINSGEVVVGKIGDDLRMDYTAQGETVGLAQRIEQVCEPGHVYLSISTARAAQGFFSLSNLGLIEMSGMSGPMDIYCLDATTQATTRLQASSTRGLTHFVGRNSEIQALDVALARAEDGHGQVVGVVGDPGLGKSRLCYEFVESCRARNIQVYEGHCPSYGTTIPFIPIMELMRSYFDIAEADSGGEARNKIKSSLSFLGDSVDELLPTLFAFLEISDPEHPAPPVDADKRQEQLFSLLDLVAKGLTDRKITSVIYIDDLHWVDSWSNQFIEKIVNTAKSNCSLVLLNFRPVYEPSWATHSHYQQMPLVPLNTQAMQEMLVDLVGDHLSLSALQEKILQWTSGNPLYCEEVVHALSETDQLVGYPGHYTLETDIQRIEIPPSIQAIIASRIDRLDERTKSVLHSASVVGKEFKKVMIESITDLPASQLAVELENLRAADFIYESVHYPSPEYTFKHPLIHEVAYETQLRDIRKSKHGLVAKALETISKERLDEEAARIAYHYELAGDPANAIQWHDRAATVADAKDPNTAVVHWQKVRAFVDQLPADPNILSQGARACGDLVRVQWRIGGDERLAGEAFDDGLDLAERANNIELQAVLSSGYAQYLGLKRAQINDAVTYAERAHALWINLLDGIPSDLSYGSRYVLPNLRWNRTLMLAMQSAMRGDKSDYRAYVKEGRNYHLDIPEIVSYTYGIDGLMSAFFAETDYGVGQARLAIEWAAKGGTSYAVANAYTALAENELMGGNYAQARESSLSAIRAAKAGKTHADQQNCVRSVLAEAEIGLGNYSNAKTVAEGIVRYCETCGLYCNLMPWLSLAHAQICLGMEDEARSVLITTQALTEKTGALLFQPWVHGYRALFAKRFQGEWKVDEEIDTAQSLFRAYGAEKHIERILKAI